MLCVLFKIAGQRYAIRAALVDEVVPLVRLSPLPGAPDYMAGVMNLRGAPVPVADLSMLLCGRPSRPWGSTRILVARPAAARGNAVTGQVGLLAERAMRTLRMEPSEMRPPGAPAGPYLDAVAVTERGIVEIIDPARLLPEPLLARLAASAEAV